VELAAVAQKELRLLETKEAEARQEMALVAVTSVRAWAPVVVQCTLAAPGEAEKRLSARQGREEAEGVWRLVLEYPQLRDKQAHSALPTATQRN